MERVYMRVPAFRLLTLREETVLIMEQTWNKM